MVANFIVALCMVIIVFYMWSDILNVRIDWKSKRTISYILITDIATLINYFNVMPIIKIINMTLVFIVIHKLYFKTDIRLSIIGPVITQLIYLISEGTVSIVMLAILNNKVDFYVSNYFGSMVMNFIISFISIFLYKLRFFRLIYEKLIAAILKLEEPTVLFLSVIGIFVYSIFGFNVFYGVDSRILMIMSITISLISFALVFMFFKAKDDYYKIYEKYNSSILSLKEFEDVLNNYRVDNHENRNHLLAIRNMTKNKKVTSFIDAILDNKEKDNSNLMHETSIIPSGGLRGLIYSKMLVMQNKNIECELDVARKVRTIELSDYGDSTLLDICKIIGIFLDNAIEEVENLDEKYIIIEMFMEDEKLKISITNIFDTAVDKSDIYKVGYSTKGGKHGYGLSLVKKLTDKNKNLKTHHEINGDEFTQVLEILK